MSALGWASERFPAKGQQASRAVQDLGGWVQGLSPGERLGNPQSETAVHVRWAPRPPAISLPPAPVPSPCPPRLRPICLGLSPLGPCRGRGLRSPLEQPQTHFGTAAETTSASQWMRDERWASFSYQTPTLEGAQGRGHLKSCLPCPGPALTGLHRAALGDPYSKGQGVPGHSYRRWHGLNGV